jgi:hypothetical protein
MTDRDRNPLTPDKTPSPPGKRKLAEGKQKAPSGLKSPGSASPSVAISKSPKHPINQEIAMDKRTGLCFHNSREAKASMDHAQWHAPKDDSTIPQTDEQECVIVKQLVDAFKDMTDAKDTEDNAYRKRFTPGNDNDKFYSDWAIEACAWDVLVSEID